MTRRPEDWIGVLPSHCVFWCGPYEERISVDVLHRVLSGWVARNAAYTVYGMATMDITTPTPTRRLRSGVIKLMNGFTLDESLLRHLKEGTVIGEKFELVWTDDRPTLAAKEAYERRYK